MASFDIDPVTQGAYVAPKDLRYRNVQAELDKLRLALSENENEQAKRRGTERAGKGNAQNYNELVSLRAEQADIRAGIDRLEGNPPVAKTTEEAVAAAVAAEKAARGGNAAEPLIPLRGNLAANEPKPLPEPVPVPVQARPAEKVPAKRDEGRSPVALKAHTAPPVPVPHPPAAPKAKVI